jgi:UrcA family protein
MLTAAVACMAAGYTRADNNTDDVRTIVVSLAGFDLSSAKGADAVYSRIRSAAKIVCAVDQSRQLAQIARARACFRNAVDDGITQANRPLLSALHARRTGTEREAIRSASR